MFGVISETQLCAGTREWEIAKLTLEKTAWKCTEETLGKKLHTNYFSQIQQTSVMPHLVIVALFVSLINILQDNCSKTVGNTLF